MSEREKERERESERKRRTEIESRTGRWQEVRERKRDRGRQLEFWRCSTAAEGELPRTRGPNPLFWTHTPASRLSAPTTCTISSLHRVLPTTAFPASAATPTPFHPERQTRHIARSVALLPSEAPRRSILYNYPACITKVAAKLFLPFALACNATPSPPTDDPPPFDPPSLSTPPPPPPPPPNSSSPRSHTVSTVRLTLPRFSRDSLKLFFTSTHPFRRSPGCIACLRFVLNPFGASFARCEYGIFAKLVALALLANF